MKIRTFDDTKSFILSEFSGGTLEIATGAFGANQQFGIDQRDGELEISQDGKLLWSSAPDETVTHATTQEHDWDDKADRPRCRNCGLEWNSIHDHGICPGEDPGERALVQLAGCRLAAKGCATGVHDAVKGDYSWSPAFQAVKDLRAECDRLRMSLEHCRHATTESFDPDSLPATGEEGVELHAFTAIRELRKRYDDARKSLEAERAANADKVQTIARQCRERRMIKEAVIRLDMPRLHEIFFPPESDEPESVEEPEIKTVVLDVGPDHLEIVDIANVTALRAERDRLHKAVTELPTKIMDRFPCACPIGVPNPECVQVRLEKILDEFKERAGIAEAKGPERAHDDAAEKHEWTATKGFCPCICRKCGKTWSQESAKSECARIPEPCDPERIKDKLVIRFDGPPGPTCGRFVETEFNGRSVKAGEWIQDGEYWLLVIRYNIVLPPTPPSDLKVVEIEDLKMLRDERDYLREVVEMCERVTRGSYNPAASWIRRSWTLMSVTKLRANRDWLKAKYQETKTKILNRTPCTCLREGVRLGETHAPTCPSKIVMTVFDEFGE